MYKFGKRSINELSTCHIDLITVANESIKDSPYDFGIIHGHRTLEHQFNIYKKGREYIDGKWVIINKLKVVSYADGYVKKSKHNYNPSEAFDIGVFVNGKLTWAKSVYVEAGLHIMEKAEELYINDKISNKLFWGGHFKKLKDWGHFQI